MNDREPADARLLTVLLEEELGAATARRRAPAPLLPRVLFAAAMLFGIAVVLGTAWLARPPRSDDGEQVAQDRGPRLVEPKTNGELQDLLAQVVRVQFAACRGWDPIYGCLPVLGATASVGDSVAQRMSSVLKGKFYAFQGPVELSAGEAGDFALLRFETRDGRAFEGAVRMGAQATALLIGDLMAHLPSDDAQARAFRMELDALAELARTAGQLWSADVADGEQIERLPLEQCAIDCRTLPLDGPLATRLTRLQRLQELSCASATAEGLRALAALPMLRKLTVAASGLDDVAAAALGELASLRTLEIGKAVTHFPASKLEVSPARLAEWRQLTSLRCWSKVAAEQAWALASLPRLQELWLTTDPGNALLVDSIVSMPALRRLAVHGYRDTGSADALLRALPRTRVERLKLMAVWFAPESLAALEGMPTLRELVVCAGSNRRRACREALAHLRQVRRLDATGIGFSSADLAELRAALPASRLIAMPDEVFKEPAYAEPNWSKDVFDRTQDPEPVQPKDLAELRKLLANVNKVTLIAAPRDAGVPVLKDLPLLGTLFTNAPPTGELPAPLVVTARADVQAWTVALLAGDAPPAAASIGPQDLKLELQLADGRVLVGAAEGYAGRAGELVMFGGVHVVATAELQQLIARSVEAMQRAWRLQRGIVVDEAELRALPADTKAITMPPFVAATLRAELPRFTALERLALARGLSPSSEAIDAIASVSTLRSLSLQAEGLDAAQVEMLARLPLRELRLTGTLRMRSVAAFGRLQRLERLELDKLDANLDLRALLASLPVLQQVALTGDDAVSDAQFAALAMTKITRLELRGPNATVDCVAKLIDVPSLRELRLEGAPTLTIDPAFMTVLGTLRQLRKLELGVAVWFRPEPGIHFAGDSAVNSAKLRALLPSCEIVETPFGSSVQLPAVPRKN